MISPGQVVHQRAQAWADFPAGVAQRGGGVQGFPAGLMNEYRKIQADRRRRERQYVEDCRRAGLPLEYPGAPHGYDVPDSEFPAKNEAIDAGEIVEDFTEETAIATRPSPASGSRNRREGRATSNAAAVLYPHRCLNGLLGWVFA